MVLADHHSVVVVDLSVEVEEVVSKVDIANLLVNHSTITVHHQCLDVHLLLDQVEASVVLCYEVVEDDHQCEVDMGMKQTLPDEDQESFADVVVQC